MGNSKTSELCFTIAVLITCFNRSEKTRCCLLNLYDQELPKNVSFEVFLCDDNSTDGTGEMLELEFPQVKVVKGNGHLYWGGGMRVAWTAAKKFSNFDAYLWLNDDTFLIPKSLKILISEYHEIGKPAILNSPCKIPNTQSFSYGGHDEKGSPMPPNGMIQEIYSINGNLVFIPKEIEEKIGMISPRYTHYLGDLDYALRAKKVGFKSYSTSTYLAECDQNNLPNWADPKLSIIKRWKLLHHVKGRAASEYVAFKSYHSGILNGINSWIDIYLRLVFTNKYVLIRKLLFNK
jgi:GT2 family glycosyltransferase